MINARAFLAKDGFVFDKKSSQLDRLFLKQFTAAKALEIKMVWQAIHTGEMSQTAHYNLPKTAKQANIMWSHDRHRFVAAFDWLLAQINYWRPKSIIEMGCGPGTFLRFVRANFPEIHLKGIDAVGSQVAIAKALADIDVEAADYLNVQPSGSKFEVVVCNFGFDLANFSPSSTSHSTMKIGQSTICPGCSDDFAVEFLRYLESWRAWGSTDAKLFLTGRLPNFGYARGVISSAAKVGWHLDLKNSRELETRGDDGVERFPAMVFTAGKSCEAVADALIEQYELVFGHGR